MSAAGDRITDRMILTCPACKKEFTWDECEYDRRIINMTGFIRQKQAILSEIEKTPQNRRVRMSLKREIEETMTAIQHLKQSRKIAHKNSDEAVYASFKALVKDRLGQQQYMKLMREALQENTPQSTQGVMSKRTGVYGG